MMPKSLKQKSQPQVESQKWMRYVEKAENELISLASIADSSL